MKEYDPQDHVERVKLRYFIRKLLNKSNSGFVEMLDTLIAEFEIKKNENGEATLHEKKPKS